MTAERLREAVWRLREAAVHDSNHDVSIGDGDLSACLNSDVARALADWLERVAIERASYEQTVEGCRSLDLVSPCGCEYKDCYECGKWHDCTHRAVIIPPEALAVADAILGES